MANQEEISDQHVFLDYKRADVHFVYSFLWKASTTFKPDAFSKGLTGTNPNEWKSPLIHERIIGDINGDAEESTWVGAYQPNFVFERRCLELSGELSIGDGEVSRRQVWLIVPMEMNASLPTAGEDLTPTIEVERSPCVVHPISNAWTMRLFDSGIGTFTVRLSLRDNACVKNALPYFSLIHWLLRLIPNLDAAPEAHENVIQDSDFPLVDSFIYSKGLGTCRLFELMLFHRDKSLKKIPKELFEETLYAKGHSFVYADEQSLAYRATLEATDVTKSVPRTPSPQTIFTKSNWRENQTPFVFITAVTPKESLERLSRSSLSLAKEVGSLFAKLTLDNRKTLKDFHHLTADYLSRALNYDANLQRLISLSHDDRLFFTFSRRGALAISDAPTRLPALFVIPSLLNLFELAKARLHSGIVLSVRLAELASSLASMKPDAISIDEIEYAHLRKLVVLNLQNPMQYLFDGGSGTELAILIEKSLMVNQVWADVRHSFAMVDRLMAAWETTQLRRRYEQSY